MHIKQNFSLAGHNTFGFDVLAEQFTRVTSTAQLQQALNYANDANLEPFILGGGSNIVFTRNVEGLVIHNAIEGLSVTPAENKSVRITAGAGYNWHDLVTRTNKLGYFGLENLALIPGSAGAAPIQNIGAYGIEIGELLVDVKAVSIDSYDIHNFDNSSCAFGYRESVFKTAEGKRYAIASITLQLSLTDNPDITYRALADALNTSNMEQPTAADVLHCVCDIRRKKLPDPALIGNVGSFFKNPIINRQKIDTLRAKYTAMPFFPQTADTFKVPAAWLIDQAGWKGHRRGAIGVHVNQALVLVNYGGGDGQQIAVLAEDICRDVDEKFQIKLMREPRFY